MKIKQSKQPIILSYPNQLPFGEKLNENLFWDIHKKCMDLAAKNPGPGTNQATPWIHLQDAVARGTITPLEALDAIDIGYLPENLTVRKSAYSHIF